MRVESALLFETPEQIYTRVFRELNPRGMLSAVKVEYRRYTGPSSFMRYQGRELTVKMSDLLADAPAPVIEALAYILISKLLRKPTPDSYVRRYRRYLNRGEVASSLERARKQRGRKLFAGPAGEYFHLEEIFEDLNHRYFFGLMSRPVIGWSSKASRTLLGHYDPSHHVIVISRIFDRADAPRTLVEYVVFHEMLHLRHPVKLGGARRCVHTPEFKQAESQFPNLAEVKRALREFLRRVQ